MTGAKWAFHAFTVKANGTLNRIITQVEVCQGFDPVQPPSPAYLSHETKALWDTGATASVITTATVNALNLKPIGIVNVNHAGGMGQSNTYLVNFVLPNKVQAAGIIVTECPAVVGDFGAIIGMDIITKGDFSITNCDGLTWASFRIPSVKRIDYVEEARHLRFAGTGRNDPCPCGKRHPVTGKLLKFKNCCGG